MAGFEVSINGRIWVSTEALTQDFIVVASDRQLTYDSGKIAHDNTCKLVLLCGVAGMHIYRMGGSERRPTNEWIAVRLAEKKCRHPAVAAQDPLMLPLLR